MDAHHAGGPGELALSVKGLSAGYGGVQVLRDVSIDVPVGRVVALLGPNGAGKTTLLRSICGFITPTAGSVFMNGVDVTSSLPHERASQSGLVHVPEGRGIFRALTVRENLRLQSIPGDTSDAIDMAVSAFPVLGERLKQAAGTLSGGQQQMLALAAAYVRQPRLILVDEPSLGLAPIIVDEVFAFLADCASRGVSILLVDQFADRVLALATTGYVLRKGEVRSRGTAAQLAASDLFAEYVGTVPKAAGPGSM